MYLNINMVEQDNVSVFVNQYKLMFSDKLHLIKQNTITKLNTMTKSNSEEEINRVMNEFISEINGLSSVNYSLPPVLAQLYNALNETEIIELKNKIKYFFIEQLKDLRDVVEKKIVLSKPDPLRPSQKNRSYDQVVKGNVKIIKIKNNSDYTHKITFHKMGKFLQYQTWDPKGIVEITHLPRDPGNENHPRAFNEAKEYIKNNPDKVKIINYKINEDREVVLKNAKEWVLFFNGVPGFTPTTVMEIGYKKYIFVIKKVKMNKNDKVVFYISTKEIHLDNKSNKMEKLKKIPEGKYKNVRFDIDYGQSTDSCNEIASGESECWCPKDSVISTLYLALPGWISTCIYSNCAPGFNKLGPTCFENSGCDWCSYEGCWSNGIGSCWRHTDRWPHCVYSPGIYEYKSYTLIATWDKIPGYFCNSAGDKNDQDGDNANCPSIPGQDFSPACWNSSDNSKYCCMGGNWYTTSPCCPPGSSC